MNVYMNNQIIIPIVVLIVVSFGLYIYSKDPEKKNKPLTFVVPGALASVGTFLILKNRNNSEPIMQGNYFD
jgi:uncharacterized BrkB/YihY/UPF0761 family membrane protein